jgi:membrane-bound lytic murein transglycosylase D
LSRAFVLFCLLAAFPLQFVSAESVETDFPLPETLRPAVGFWKRVYLEVTTDGGLLHDSRRLGVVYEVVRFERDMSQRARDRHVKHRRAHWKGVLRHLATGAAAERPEEHRARNMLILALGREPNRRDYGAVSRRIRFQLGQRNKFRAGLIRSGGYEDAMRDVFRRHGLPEDLATLPHVESSFNVHAYSKYGAAGAWQFMRSTGRRFMRVDYVVDERLDPMAATEAAARLLKQNHESLRTWPLAITAYNHGAAGLRRAVRRLGTRDIGTIAEEYKSRRFGFASRNFYAQFLAARTVVRNYESYFGPLQRELPQPVDEVTLPFFADLKDLSTYLGVGSEVIKHYNPSLRPPVYRGVKRIPKGFVLRLPAGTVGADASSWLVGIPAERRHAKQHRSRFYQVRRGDTLSRIASRNGTTIRALVAHNNLPSRHRIYAGQVLELPEPGKARRRSSGLVPRAQAAPRAPTAPKAPKPPPSGEVMPLSGPPPPSIPEDSPWRRVNGDWVLVDTSETLGHFADWLGVSTTRLRRLNRLAAGRALRMGQRLELDFSRVDPDVFLERRMEFHKGVEEDFFGSYRITGTVEHRLGRGENLWILSHKTFRVPIWLIHRFNPDADLLKLAPGADLRIPVVEAI